MIRVIVDAASKPAVLAAHKNGRLREVFGDAAYQIQEERPEAPGHMRTIAGGSTANNVTHYAGGAAGAWSAGGAGGAGSFGELIAIGGGGAGPHPSIPECPHCGASGGGGHGGGCLGAAR